MATWRSWVSPVAEVDGAHAALAEPAQEAIAAQGAEEVAGTGLFAARGGHAGIRESCSGGRRRYPGSGTQGDPPTSTDVSAFASFRWKAEFIGLSHAVSNFWTTRVSRISPEMPSACVPPSSKAIPAHGRRISDQRQTATPPSRRRASLTSSVGCEGVFTSNLRVGRISTLNTSSLVYLIQAGNLVFPP